MLNLCIFAMLAISIHSYKLYEPRVGCDFTTTEDVSFDTTDHQWETTCKGAQQYLVYPIQPRGKFYCNDWLSKNFGTLPNQVVMYDMLPQETTLDKFRIEQKIRDTIGSTSEDYDYYINQECQFGVAVLKSKGSHTWLKCNSDNCYVEGFSSLISVETRVGQDQSFPADFYGKVCNDKTGSDSYPRIETSPDRQCVVGRIGDVANRVETLPLLGKAIREDKLIVSLGGTIIQIDETFLIPHMSLVETNKYLEQREKDTATQNEIKEEVLKLYQALEKEVKVETGTIRLDELEEKVSDLEKFRLASLILGAIGSTTFLMMILSAILICISRKRGGPASDG